MFKKMMIAFVLLMTVGFSQVKDTWLRIDSNQNGQIIWVGGANGNYVHDVVYYVGSNLLEASVGLHAIPSQAFGLFDIYLLGGVIGTTDAEVWWLMPQAYWFSTGEKHYSELWYCGYVAQQDFLDNGHWALFMERYAVTPNFKIGPHLEWSYWINTQSGSTENVQSLLAGVGVQIPYGGKYDYIDFALTKNYEDDSRAFKLTYFKAF